MSSIHVIEHPLIIDRLSEARKKDTSHPTFRRNVNEVGMLLGYEALRSLKMTPHEIETPVAPMAADFISQEITIMSILRAGNGLLDGVLKAVPNAHVGHVGLYRDPKSFEAVEYFYKEPPHMESHKIVVVDPMLATGHSAVSALDRIKSGRELDLTFICLLAAPEGIEYLQAKHPTVPIYTAAIDERLNDKKYIVPGLGDAGDRIFGTL